MTTIKVNFKTDKTAFTISEVVKVVTQQLGRMPYLPIEFIGIQDSEKGAYMLFRFGEKIFRETKMTREIKGFGLCLEEVKAA